MPTPTTLLVPKRGTVDTGLIPVSTPERPQTAWVQVERTRDEYSGKHLMEYYISAEFDFNDLPACTGTGGRLGHGRGQRRDRRRLSRLRCTSGRRRHHGCGWLRGSRSRGHTHPAPGLRGPARTDRVFPRGGHQSRTSPAAPPPAVPAPQPQVFGQAEPPPFASSRQLRQAGETEPGDTSPEYWRAKYDGVIGAAQERWRKMTGQIEAGQMEVRARDDQIARITTDLEAVRAQAATLVTTQQALEAANAQIAQLQGQVA